MKSVLAMGALCVLIMVGPVRADDGRVDESDLSSLGLGGLQVMSDEEGSAVRGRIITSSVVIGTSFFSFQINNPGGPTTNSMIDTQMQSNMNPTVASTSVSFGPQNFVGLGFFASININLSGMGMISFAP